MKKKLLIVGPNSILAEVADVDSIYRTFKPFGRHFFRDDDFQWSRDSKVLYLVKDKYYQSSGSQLFSKNGELWKLDLATKSLSLVLKPFAAFDYFFGDEFQIFYSEPTRSGALQLKLFNGATSINIGPPNADNIRELPGGNRAEPFHSFSINDYERALPSLHGVHLVLDRDNFDRLVINNRTYLTASRVKGWDGYSSCIDLVRSVFLPGDRFFLLNIPYCGNFRGGQLLFNVETAEYETLPPDTAVFVTLNTGSFKKYRVTSSGIELTLDANVNPGHTTVRNCGTQYGSAVSVDRYAEGRPAQVFTPSGADGNWRCIAALVQRLDGSSN